MNKGKIQYKLDNASIIAFVVGVLVFMLAKRLAVYGLFKLDSVGENIMFAVILAFFATLFGSVTGFLTGFLGVISSLAACHEPIIFGDAVMFAFLGFYIGQFADKYFVREGRFGLRQAIAWNLTNISGLIASFVFIKPLVDYIFYNVDLFDAASIGFRVVLIAAIPVGLIFTLMLFLLSKFFGYVKS